MRFLQLPSWAPDIALGAIGGALGSYGTLFVSGAAAWNWSAASAIATFSAVLVALYPTWRKEERRKAAAVALRSFLAPDLLQLHHYLRRSRDEGELLGGPPIFSHEPASQALEALVAMALKTEVLDADEQELLVHAVRTCEVTRRNASLIRDSQQTVAGLLVFVARAGDRINAALGQPSMASLYDKMAEKYGERPTSRSE